MDLSQLLVHVVTMVLRYDASLSKKLFKIVDNERNPFVVHCLDSRCLFISLS